MINMEHCRFENTLLAWEECKDAINNNELVDEDEKRCAKKLFESMLNMMLDEGIIESYDQSAIEEWME